MALTYTHRPGGSAPCPECKEPISKEANICPHCRSDLKENEEWQAAKGESGCAMVLVFAVIGVTAVGSAVYHSFC